MTQYMLAVHNDPSAPELSPEELPTVFKAVDDFNAGLQASGNWVFGGGLLPIESSTTVRVNDGDALLTDGPFVETKEHLGGFWIIEAEDLDAALEIAKRGAIACRGAVEVRPFQDEPAPEA